MLRQAIVSSSALRAALLGLLLVGLAGCGIAPAAAPTRAPVAAAPSQSGSGVGQQARPRLLVDARVVPALSVGLDFGLRGVSVAEVLVAEGDLVTKGAPLARLDAGDLQLRIDAARATMARAQAEYDRLAAGPGQAELDYARAEVDAARARLLQAQGSVVPAELDAARARLSEARAMRALLEAGPLPADRQAALSERDQARARLAELAVSLSAAKEQERRLMEEAANQVRVAQQLYSDSYWAHQHAASDATKQALAGELERRRLAVASAELALERARLSYEVALQGERSGLADAEAELAAAQARLDELLGRPDGAELERARAVEAEAAAQLARLEGSARVGAIDEAAAGVRAAEARLAQLEEGARPAELAAAAAGVEQAAVQLRQAERELAKATLLAPMDGVVAEINVAPGEIPDVDQPAMLLADNSAWQLEAAELTDLNIVQVAPGAPAMISFDALPDLELTGQVSRISPLGENERGETLYTIYIDPDSWDARLRWNMLAQVRIGP